MSSELILQLAEMNEVSLSWHQEVHGQFKVPAKFLRAIYE